MKDPTPPVWWWKDVPASGLEFGRLTYILYFEVSGLKMCVLRLIAKKKQEALRTIYSKYATESIRFITDTESG